MANFKGTVFVTQNLINLKVYVGMTTINKSTYIGSGRLFKKAIKKYGRNNFKKEILRDNIPTLEETRFWEDFYVKLYNSTDLNIGYNVVPGGLTGGWSHRPESIEKIKTAANRPERINISRDCQKIAANSRIGIHHSNEVKRNMAKIKFGENRIIEIFEKETNKLYNVCFTSKEAEVLTGVKRSAISNNLIGMSKACKKFIFKYKTII